MAYIVMAKKPRGKWRDVSKHVTLAAAKKAADRLSDEYDVTIHDTSGRRHGMEWEKGDTVLPRKVAAPKRGAAKKKAARRKAVKRAAAKGKKAAKKTIREINRWL